MCRIFSIYDKETDIFKAIKCNKLIGFDEADDFHFYFHVAFGKYASVLNLINCGDADSISLTKLDDYRGTIISVNRTSIKNSHIFYTKEELINYSEECNCSLYLRNDDKERWILLRKNKNED